ncbi:DHA2 family efflux MFS transporter permease subunit [Mucilaginibacter conchicola]|uniref:DHA2 family efflux MFS transporter permease subunit n=1 Tax=Mucilaginibacter conchicola TaxID=2303333 RepID=A0A372NMU9_9SPHI|nr:DHA2 family efflux MFS transporter permease subunit [Mucilaginibacter conchicola]RFZ90274.1 DHA2 family efflux MFS transporter permease subunit [Mucilaginibacter conchicola]
MQPQTESLIEHGPRLVIITITAVFCALLEIIDTTIVNVALNSMRGSLGATLSEISWVITAYSLANVIMIPLSSWLSQQFGRRNYFAGSVILFTICSFLCGNAHSVTELVIFRFLQGIGGGALLVTSQTIITESWPPHKRAMAQAIYFLGVIVGPTLGPPLGGYIVDNISWPYIFYINIPVGIMASILTIQYVRSPSYGKKQSLMDADWLGIILLTVGLSSLQYVLEKGQEDDWFNSELIIVLSVAAFLGLYLFVWRQLVVAFPVVDLRVLKDNNLRIGVTLSFVLGVGTFGSTFIIPLFTQSVLGWSAQQAGVLQLPSTLFVAVMMPVVATLIQKGVQQKWLIAVGMFLFYCFCMLTYHIIVPDTSAGDFFWPLMVRGAGLGLLSVPISTMSLSTLKGAEISQGAAFSGMMRQLGGSFGIAMITTFLARKTSIHRADVARHLNVFDNNVQQHISQLAAGFHRQGLDSLASRNSAYQVIEAAVNKQATLLSYMDVMMLVGGIFIVFVPLVLLFIRRSKNKVSLADAAH